MTDVATISPAVPFDVAFRDLAELVWARHGISIFHPDNPFKFTFKPVPGRRAFLIVGWMRSARTIEELSQSLVAAYFGEPSEAMLNAYLEDPDSMSWAAVPQQDMLMVQAASA